MHMRRLPNATAWRLVAVCFCEIVVACSDGPARREADHLPISPAGHDASSDSMGDAGVAADAASAPELDAATVADGSTLPWSDSGAPIDGSLGRDAGLATGSDAAWQDANSTPPVASFDDVTCDPGAIADVNQGVFADAEHGSDDSLGTAELPFKTISRAVEKAVAEARSNVYLAEGSYDSVPELASAAVLLVQGGWVRHGGAWYRDCSAEVPHNVVLTQPVVSRAVRGGLRALTVRAMASPSNVAIRVLEGQFTLRHVVAQAGDGTDGQPGAPGLPGLNGEGSTHACGDGAMGGAGQDGAHGEPGSFAPDGNFTPSLGHHGVLATAGQAGAPGESISCVSEASCQTQQRVCGSHQCNPRPCRPHQCNPHSCNCTLFGCDTCFDVCYDTCFETCPDYCYSCDAPTAVATHTLAGECGLGGSAGGAGEPGTGGGASVALFVANGATAEVFVSDLVAGNGGAGTAGGVGGAGGLGSHGAGSSAACVVRCELGTPTACRPSFQTVTAPAGGRGGDGGRGPAGVMQPAAPLSRLSWVRRLQ